MSFSHCANTHQQGDTLIATVLNFRTQARHPQHTSKKLIKNKHILNSHSIPMQVFMANLFPLTAVNREKCTGIIMQDSHPNLKAETLN